MKFEATLKNLTSVTKSKFKGWNKLVNLVGKLGKPDDKLRNYETVIKTEESFTFVKQIFACFLTDDHESAKKGYKDANSVEFRNGKLPEKFPGLMKEFKAELGKEIKKEKYKTYGDYVADIRKKIESIFDSEIIRLAKGHKIENLVNTFAEPEQEINTIPLDIIAFKKSMIDGYNYIKQFMVGAENYREQVKEKVEFKDMIMKSGLLKDVSEYDNFVKNLETDVVFVETTRATHGDNYKNTIEKLLNSADLMGQIPIQAAKDFRKKMKSIRDSQEIKSVTKEDKDFDTFVFKTVMEHVWDQSFVN